MIKPASIYTAYNHKHYIADLIYSSRQTELNTKMLQLQRNVLKMFVEICNWKQCTDSRRYLCYLLSTFNVIITDSLSSFTS